MPKLEKKHRKEASATLLREREVLRHIALEIESEMREEEEDGESTLDHQDSQNESSPQFLYPRSRTSRLPKELSSFLVPHLSQDWSQRLVNFPTDNHFPSTDPTNWQSMIEEMKRYTYHSEYIHLSDFICFYRKSF